MTKTQLCMMVVYDFLTDMKLLIFLLNQLHGSILNVIALNLDFNIHYYFRTKMVEESVAACKYKVSLKKVNIANASITWKEPSEIVSNDFI